MSATSRRATVRLQGLISVRPTCKSSLYRTTSPCIRFNCICFVQEETVHFVRCNQLQTNDLEKTQLQSMRTTQTQLAPKNAPLKQVGHCMPTDDSKDMPYAPAGAIHSDAAVIASPAGTAIEPDMIRVESPPHAGNGTASARSDSSAGTPPQSPAGNRARFMAGVQPSKVTCDLSNVSITPGLRFSFEAVITVVYPASPNLDRRYVELGDAQGSTGITVWNSYVNAITPDCVGRVVKFSRLAITVHNGKKSLTMSKESTMHVEHSNYVCSLSIWWNNLLSAPVCNALQFHDATASIVNISGILGLIQVEEKMVKGVPKNLLVLHLTDSTGRLEIRSWNHSDTEFLQYLEKPVQLQRVRVVLYAGQKTGELLGGDNGTVLTTDFDKSSLIQYWKD